MEPITPESETNVPQRRPGLRWLILIALLIGPALLAALGAAIKSDGLAVASPLLGGAIGGIVCGIFAGQSIGRTPLGKVAAGIFFAALFGVVTVGIGFAGCCLGGFKMDFR